MAFGGSNWLDRVSAGLATLLAQQACLSPSLSCCSARQDCSQLNCCHVPFKACREAGDGSSCCPRGAAGIQGLWSLVGTSVLGRAWVLDSWETSITPHPFIPLSIYSHVPAKQYSVFLTCGKTVWTVLLEEYVVFTVRMFWVTF